MLPYFAFAPYVVAETDLVFTTARHFAEAFMALLPLTLLNAPKCRSTTHRFDLFGWLRFAQLKASFHMWVSRWT